MKHELYHHGIKGQKWGVRRYQRLNGTLTRAGKARLARIREESDKRMTKEGRNRIDSAGARSAAYVEAEKTKAGISSTSDNGVDRISKGSSIYRIANSNEPLDSKRKYASLTEGDRTTYQTYWDWLGADWDKPVSEYTYTASKDLKVANGKNVTEYILNKYGTKRYRQLLSESTLADGIYSYDPHTKSKTISDEDQKWLSEFRQSGREKAETYIVTKLRNNLDKIIDDFKRQGYDAIVDIEDSRIIADYPVILLDPSNSVAFVKEDRSMF